MPALKNGRSSPEAFGFLFEILATRRAAGGQGARRGQGTALTGPEVPAGMRASASQIFGPLACAVWPWGVRETIDWRHIA